MRVEQLGSGTPELAIVGGIHGDEPCGVHAIERLLESPPPVKRPVKLVVANERALEAGVRYVDEDLNRTFPGDPSADTHEGRLAHRLVTELEGCLTFSMHSTRSYAEPFAIVNGLLEDAVSICRQLPVDAIVDTGRFDRGRLFTAVDTVEVECGLQESASAAANAVTLARKFLIATGAVPKTPARRVAPAFRLVDCIPKTEGTTYEVFVENFERVDAGEPFAAVDGRPHYADEPFYPVLLSADGYESVFGYTARKVDAPVGPADTTSAMVEPTDSAASSSRPQSRSSTGPDG